MVIGIFLIFPGEFAIADVVQVLQPLKVRHSHTPSIGKQVGNHQHLAIMQDFLSSYGGGTIRTLGYYLDSKD